MWHSLMQSSLQITGPVTVLPLKFPLTPAGRVSLYSIVTELQIYKAQIVCDPRLVCQRWPPERRRSPRRADKAKKVREKGAGHVESLVPSPRARSAPALTKNLFIWAKQSGLIQALLAHIEPPSTVQAGLLTARNPGVNSSQIAGHSLWGYTWENRIMATWPYLLGIQKKTSCLSNVRETWQWKERVHEERRVWHQEVLLVASPYQRSQGGHLLGSHQDGFFPCTESWWKVLWGLLNQGEGVTGFPWSTYSVLGRANLDPIAKFPGLMPSWMNGKSILATCPKGSHWRAVAEW